MTLHAFYLSLSYFWGCKISGNLFKTKFVTSLIDNQLETQYTKKFHTKNSSYLYFKPILLHFHILNKTTKSVILARNALLYCLPMQVSKRRHQTAFSHRDPPLCFHVGETSIEN